MPNLIVSAVSTFDNKGLKKGTKEVSAFEKRFMADEKAAKSLEQQLKNTGYQFSAPGVELYIANLQKATGVLDDDLRPALQQLLTVTGSITKSQEALSTALNISAATGKSLSEVSSALTRGYAGNTTGLSRLGAGLSKALLKTGDMEKITGALSARFSGQALGALDTYTKQMDALDIASANAKESIGKGLLDSLALLGGDKGIDSATKDMERFGVSIADSTYGLAKMLKTLKVPEIAVTLNTIAELASLLNTAIMVSSMAARLP